MKSKPATSAPTRVAVIEDDSRLRRSITELLASELGCEFVGAFRTGEAAVEQLPALLPEVVLVDINLPGISGIDCIRQLSPRMERTRFLVLTVYQDSETIFAALTAGAHGYLLKPVDPAELSSAILSASSGGAPMTSAITRKLIEYFHRPAPESLPTEVATLATREREVLEQLSRGLAYKEIAELMGCSYSTINTHLQRIYRKLHVRSRGEAVAAYFKIAPKGCGEPGIGDSGS
jgi:DNA-binding NarL/FixJ family response regulator